MSSVSNSKMDLLHYLTVLCQIGLPLLFLRVPKPNSELLLDILGKIFLAGLCQQHKQYPRLYILYDHIRQTTAICRDMERNIMTD